MNNNKKWISSVVFISMGLCQYLSTENQTIFMCICLAFLGILFCFVVRRVTSVLVYFWFVIVMVGLIAGVLFNQGIISADTSDYIICGSLSLVFLLFGVLAWSQNRKIAYGEFFCAFLVIVLSVIVKI